MIRPTEIKALNNYKVWIKYSDGIAGEVDLSDFVGKGIFQKWSDETIFKNVCIGNNGELSWGNDIELCPDTIYMKITKKTPEELFPNLREDKKSA